MDKSLYIHTTEGKDDMPAHIKSSLTNNQITLSIKNSEIILGTWQGLYLFEHRLEESGDILYTTGDKSVRIAVWNFSKNKEEIDLYFL